MNKEQRKENATQTHICQSKTKVMNGVKMKQKYLQELQILC